MLPQQNRIKKKKDFERVFKKGKSFKQGFLILKIVLNNLTIGRFGFIVSQKISKKASVRNKIKRRLRELVRLKLPQIKKGMDGVLVVLPGLEAEDFKEMEKIINKLFKKSKLIP